MHPCTTPHDGFWQKIAAESKPRQVLYKPIIVDLAAVGIIAYLETCLYDMSPYPAVVKWYRTMKQRPSFDKIAPK